MKQNGGWSHHIPIDWQIAALTTKISPQNKSLHTPKIFIIFGTLITLYAKTDIFSPKIKATQMLVSYIRYSGTMITNMVIRSA